MWDDPYNDTESGQDYMDDNDESYQRSVDDRIIRESDRIARRQRLARKKEDKKDE
jgi:hypothetical protein